MEFKWYFNFIYRRNTAEEPQKDRSKYCFGIMLTGLFHGSKGSFSTKGSLVI